MRMRTMLKRKIKLICNWSTATEVRMGGWGGDGQQGWGHVAGIYAENGGRCGGQDRPSALSAQFLVFLMQSLTPPLLSPSLPSSSH